MPFSSPEDLPESPSQQELRNLDECLLKLRETSEEITAMVRELLRATPEHRNLIQQMLLLMEDIRILPNQDYRRLMGLINFLRHQEGTVRLPDVLRAAQKTAPPDLSQLLARLQTLYTQAKAGIPEEECETFDHAFASNSALLIRATYPAGVNVVNPRWQEGEPISLDATKENVLRNTHGDQVVLRPRNAHSVLIHYPRLEGRSIRTKAHVLEDGRSAIIGRSLHIKRLFGISLEDHESRDVSSIAIEPDCDVGDKNAAFARAGIAVTLKDGRLFVFDKGCLNTLSFEEIGGVSGTYLSRSVKTEDGWTFGERRWDVDPPELNDDEQY